MENVVQRGRKKGHRSELTLKRRRPGQVTEMQCSNAHSFLSPGRQATGFLGEHVHAWSTRTCTAGPSPCFQLGAALIDIGDFREGKAVLFETVMVGI